MATPADNQLSRYGAIARALPLTLGKVFFVVNGADSWAVDLQNEFPVDRDGVQRVYVHSATASVVTSNGIQAALNACVTARDDYVIVMPSTTTYYVDETISLDKRSVHFISPSTQYHKVGCTSNVRLQQITAATSLITITNAGIEVAGFYLKNITGYAHITVVTTASAVESCWGLSIHNNYFVSRSTTTTLPMLDCNGDGAAYSRIENNWFTTQVSSGAWTAGVIDIEQFAVNTEVVGNYIVIGDSGTATYGIRNLSTKGVVAYNIFSECGTSTITSCVTIGVTGSAIGNRCAVATGHFSDASGTSGVSYCDNADGLKDSLGSDSGWTGQLNT